MNLELKRETQDFIDAENAIMLTMVNNYKEFVVLLEYTNKAFFKLKENKYIFNAMNKLFGQGKSWDLVSICVLLPKVKKHLLYVNMFEENQKDTYSALKLIQNINETNKIENAKSKFKTYSEELNTENSDLIVNELIDNLSENKGNQKSIKQLMEDYKEWIFKTRDLVETKFSKVNKLLGGGWEKGGVHVIAGRPGQGKTALICTLINHDLKQNRKVGFISIEMSANQILTRLISNYTKIDSIKIRDFELNKQEVTQVENAVKYYTESNLVLNDSTRISGIQIFNRIKLWKIQYKIDICYIDYLGLIQTNAKDKKNEALEQNMQWIKFASKETNIPIVLLSQLNREVENRSSKYRFQLSDLRDSGSIEQDAHTVSFIVRPEFYGAETIKIGNEQINTKGLALWSFMKNREGRTGDVLLKFEGASTSFESYFEPKPEESAF